MIFLVTGMNLTITRYLKSDWVIILEMKNLVIIGVVPKLPVKSMLLELDMINHFMLILNVNHRMRILMAFVSIA